MTVVTVGIIGIMTVLMAVQLKSLKGEYGLYLVLAAACVIFFYGTLRLRGILEGMQKIQNMIRINPVYLNTLLKMTGITYIAEFSSGICKDAGYGALGTQIEIFGKLSILAVSLPVILALLDTLQIEIHQAALKSRRLILAPGNYGLDYLAANYPALHEIPIVKISNFIGEALDMAAAEHFAEVLLVGHVGKLVKLAGGIMNTHSRCADCRTELFCAHAALCGADAATCRALMDAATTDACLDILDAAQLRELVMASLLTAIQLHLDRRAAGAFKVGAVLFSNRNGPLGQTKTADTLLKLWKEA